MLNVELKNACTIDNFFCMTNCWYISNPESLELIQHSNIASVKNLYETVSLLLSGNYDAATVLWVNMSDKSAYAGPSKDGTVLDFFGTYTGLVYAPLQDFSEREFEAGCTSTFFPGRKKNTLHGFGINFIQCSVNLIEESISM